MVNYVNWLIMLIG